MELIWISYRTKKKLQRKLALFLLLGTGTEKIHLLKTSKLHQREIAKIRSVLTMLESMPLSERIRWLRDNVPNGFRFGYRTILNKHFSIIKRYKPTSS